MASKKISIITASAVIPLIIFGVFITTSDIFKEKLYKYSEPFPFETWILKYDGTQESFPTELLGQKICDITYRCEVPIQTNVSFFDDLVAIYERAPQSTLENFYGEKITNDTVFLDLTGTWHVEADRLKIKQFIEEIPGVSDVGFSGSVMP